MPEPRQYELIYVIAPDVDDAGVADLHTRVETIVTGGGGQIDKTDNWGRRRLAYEIDRHREGTYVLELFTGSGAIVGELDRRLKVADNVLRYLIVRVDEDLRKAERARTRRQAKRQQRQSGRVAAPAPEAGAPEAAVTPKAADTPEVADTPEAPKAADTAEAAEAVDTPDTAGETKASGDEPAAEVSE